MKRILVVAQVPPPYHGQAIMQQYFVDAQWGSWCDKIHVRMDFSSTLDSVGKPSLLKVVRLLSLLARCLKVRIRGPVDLLVYPPAGDSWTGTLRDIVVLILLRPLVKCTMFHFHAGNFDTSIQSLPRPLRWVARRAFSRPDVAVVLSPLLISEVSALQPKQIAVVPNGIPDAFPGGGGRHGFDRPLQVLYVGTLSEAKGTLLLVRAAAELISEGTPIELHLVGEPDTPDLSQELRAVVETAGVADYVRFHGRLVGAAKWQAYKAAGVFCFPTHYGRENQPVAVIEALMAGLPVVATTWRAVGEMLTDGVEGLLIPPNDLAALKSALKRLAGSTELRVRLADAARQRFEADYRLEDHLARLERLVRQAVA